MAFEDFGRWFAELWQGEKLGKTVAWISILASLAIYLFSNYLAPDSARDDRSGRKRDQPDQDSGFGHPGRRVYDQISPLFAAKTG